MKRIARPTAFLFAFACAIGISACSTCYECSQLIPLIDATTGDTIDYTIDIDEFCTADVNEVNEKEAEGAHCQTQ
jgi:hypothetical protein